MVALLIGLVFLATMFLLWRKERKSNLPKNRAQLRNETNPSYDVHEALSKTFVDHGRNFGALSTVERNFLRVYEFESRLANGGLVEFFCLVPTHVAWEQTRSAFYDTGMAWWGDVFSNLIKTDRSLILKCLSDGLENDWQKLGAWDDKFWNAIPQTEMDGRLYIQCLLDNYVLENYPWAKSK